MAEAITVKNLTKNFEYYKKAQGLQGSFKNLFHREKLIKEAVKGLNLEVEEGEFVGFLGPNGAGKTTSLKILSGILFPTSGDASVLGYTPWDRKKDFKRQISIVMGQTNQLWWDLPANESMILNQKIYDMALDSLISTIGRCEEYSSDAKELGCEGEISDIQAKAEEALEAFKIDTEKALEVYDMKDRTAYSKEIYQILDDAGLSEE